ncbi:MAG TPA: hypothetical protein VJI33_04915 [Candidatus Paceibacterota bacterium]
MAKTLEKNFSSLISKLKIRRMGGSVYHSYERPSKDSNHFYFDSKKDSIKMCKNCSAFYYDGLWYDEAPDGFMGLLHKKNSVELSDCPVCVYLEYKKKCLVCGTQKGESPCPSCQYLYYKVNQSIGVVAA